MARRRNVIDINEEVKQFKRKLRLKKALKIGLHLPPDKICKCAVGDDTIKCAFRAALSDGVTKHQRNHFNRFTNGESSTSRNWKATQEEIDQLEEELRNSKQLHTNIYFFPSPFSNQKSLFCCLCFNLATPTVTSPPIARQPLKRWPIEPQNTHVRYKITKLQHHGKWHIQRTDPWILKPKTYYFHCVCFNLGTPTPSAVARLPHFRFVRVAHASHGENIHYVSPDEIVLDNNNHFRMTEQELEEELPYFQQTETVLCSSPDDSWV